MSKNKKFYEKAYTLAMTSQCKYKFGAVIVRKNKIISYGVNVIKTHPAQKNYGDFCISIHAELQALLKCQSPLKNDAIMYIARYSIHRDSRPCLPCRTYIKEAGITTIVYYKDGFITEETL